MTHESDEQVPQRPADEPSGPVPDDGGHPFARPLDAFDRVPDDSSPPIDPVLEPTAMSGTTPPPPSSPPTLGGSAGPPVDPFAPAVPWGTPPSDPFAPQPTTPPPPGAVSPFATASEDSYSGETGSAYGYAASPWGNGGSDVVGAPVAEGRRDRRRGGFTVPLAVVLALVAGVVGGAVGFGIADRQDSQLTDANATLGAVGSGSSERPDDSIAGIAARVLPTVVSISVRTRSQGGSGSGFIIDGDGYILTNNHVIDAAVDGGEIAVTYADGSSESARIVGRDTSYDLAVLKVEREGLPVAALGDSDATVVGDTVLAVGSPLGLQGTVTTGIVSAKDRPVTSSGDGTSTDSFINAIQTDAAINPGNSGGPLVDTSSSVIGVSSAIASLSVGSDGQAGSIGLGFAIPMNQARRVAEEIIRTGRSTQPIIGATVDGSFDGPGSRLGGSGSEPITRDGPADRAGLEAGDIVLSVDGRLVNGAAELIVAIRANAPGDTIELRVRGANGRERDVTLVLGSRPGD
jgi:putative serine protease PepD